LPFLRSIAFVLGNAVSGIGAQPARGTIHVIAAAIAIVLNLLLLKHLGYPAAVIALISAESFTIVAFTGVLLLLPGGRRSGRRHRRGRQIGREGELP